jgi:exosome complex protein LRP1
MALPETLKLKSQLTNLGASLEELEDVLEPLFGQSLPESLVSLDPIQQAKLQTVIPYVLYDLVFSMRPSPGFRHSVHISSAYLKLKGIDPRTHLIVSELVMAFPCYRFGYAIYLDFFFLFS